MLFVAHSAAKATTGPDKPLIVCYYALIDELYGGFLMSVSLDKLFMATEDGENIYFVDYANKSQQQIGITKRVADELTQALATAIAKRDEYKAMLEAAGIIQKEQTPEETVQQLTAALQDIRQMCVSLQDENASLKSQFGNLLARLGEVPES